MHVSVLNILAFGLTLFLTVFTVNVSRVTNDRIEFQSGLDAAVISAATVKARGMNAVTAINHLIGELHAFTVMHDAIGGIRADEPGRYQPINGEKVKWLNRRLAIARFIVIRLGARAFAYRQVRENINANQALFDAKCTLKSRLTALYVLKIGTQAVINWGTPIARALAIAFMTGVLDPADQWIKQEDQTLRGILTFARLASPAKWIVRNAAIPFLRVQQEQIIRKTPELAQQTADEVASSYGIQVYINREDLKLPVVPDPQTVARGPLNMAHVEPVNKKSYGDKAKEVRNQIAKTTQLARAAYPWVVYHRSGITQITDWIVPVSNFSGHYRQRTFEQTVEQTEKLRSMVYALPVLKHYPAPNKGYAPWTEGGSHGTPGAGPLFSVLGVGTRRPPPVIGQVYFGKSARRSMTLSQALVYNANLQQRRDSMMDVKKQLGSYRRQPAIGWDTLNFVGRVSEAVSDPVITKFPAVKLNWQTKLVPVSADHLENSTLPAIDSSVADQLRTFQLNREMISTH